MKLKIQTKQVIECQDWNVFVAHVYGRPYNFQQQDGCQGRGTRELIVPDEEAQDFEVDSIAEKVNGPEMGVSFKAWLARDPKQKLSNPDEQEDYCLDLWWSRNFYPDVGIIANDLHAKGLLEAGEYIINIDW